MQGHRAIREPQLDALATRRLDRSQVREWFAAIVRTFEQTSLHIDEHLMNVDAEGSRAQCEMLIDVRWRQEGSVTSLPVSRVRLLDDKAKKVA